MVKEIDELTGHFAGDTMCVLGNGPSLLDVELPSERSRQIGVNRIFRTHSPDHVVIIDLDVWKQEKKSVEAADRTLLTTPNLVRAAGVTGLPIEMKRPVVLFGYDINPDTRYPFGPLFKGNLTGYYAAEIAARMVYPYGTVVLAGMDLKWPDDNAAPTHSFGDGRDVGCRDHMFEYGIKAFVRLKEALHGAVTFRVLGESALLDEGFLSA